MFFGVGHELELIVLYGLESLDRRCYVGLSDVEVVYFYASFLGGISIGNEFPYGRCGQCLSFFRKCQHDIFVYWGNKVMNFSAKTSKFVFC